MNLNDYSVTKKKIFLASCKLFFQKCYADVGIREIAIEAGVKVPTVYNHYPSKESILEDLLRFYEERILSFHSRSKDIDYAQPPIECFKQMAFAYEDAEIDLMRQLMRIVLTEQHRSAQAARIVFDISIRSAKEGYYNFLLHLKNKGVIQCEGIDSFAEIFARLGITFAMQYVRDDEIRKRPDYFVILMDMFDLILNYSPPHVRDECELKKIGCAQVSGE